MLNIVYTLSPTIKDHLLSIDTLRKTILTIPISPTNEHKLRWQATFAKIWGSLQLGNLTITKSELTTCLTSPSKRPTMRESQALAYKQALDVIRDTWTASPKPLTPSVIEELARIALRGSQENVNRYLTRAEQDLKHLTSYLDSERDHPVVLAAVAQAQIAASPLTDLTQGRLSRLSAYLILAKYGFDIRGTLALEPQWLLAAESFTRAFESIKLHGQLTGWLEYYTKTAKAALESLLAAVREGRGGDTEASASLWELNERQKGILALLDNPTVKITNRDIQKRWKVSQITASRDLARLVGLGLIFPHGKGRAASYRRI